MPTAARSHRRSPSRASCGGLNQLCCANNSCTNGTCVGSSPPQCACGQRNGDPDTDPPQCVPPGGACATSSGGACGPGHGDLCCSWQDRCVLDQFTEIEQCNIPDANN